MKLRTKRRFKNVLHRGKIAVCWALAVIVGYLAIVGLQNVLVQVLNAKRTIVIVNPNALTYAEPTQTYAETAEPGSNKAVIQRVAQEENIDWKVLYGICMEEARGCTSYDGNGDNGQSWGWFQINHPSHPEVTKEQATDLAWSAHWTAQRLKAYAEKGGWEYAIRKHNGNADLATGKWAQSFNATLAYLARVKNNIAEL